MEYNFIERQPHQRGHNWFGHQITLHLPHKRKAELIEQLNSTIGPQGRHWRLKANRSASLIFSPNADICFLEKKDAMQFKLTWDEDIVPEDPMDRWYQKLRANSVFGKMASIRPAGALINQIVPSTPGIYPMTIHQHKSRLSRLPKDSIVFLDYESSRPLKWYDSLPSYTTKINSWFEYDMTLEQETSHEAE